MRATRRRGWVLVAGALIVAACSGGGAPAATPTSGPTAAPTSAPTATARPTLAPTPTPSPLPALTAAATPTRAPTATSAPTATPTLAPTPAPTATPTAAALPPTGVVTGKGRYAWLDTTDPAPPDASKIRATDLDGWRSRVQGDPGSVAPNRPVLVSTLDLPNTVLTTSGPQGEFTAELYAPPGSTVQIKHDPTGRFLLPAVLNDPRPHQVNVPPGTTIRNDPTPAGSTSFLLVGRVTNDLEPFVTETLVPYKIAGSVGSLQLSPGGTFQLRGTVEVLLPPGSTVPATPAMIGFALRPIASAGGSWTGAWNQTFGGILRTAVGAPVEHFDTGPARRWLVAGRS